MARVEDVADIIINYMNAEPEPYISNLMLNKLLYFAQGHCLAETGKPLFDDDFEAWDYGPVIPKIYRKYKMCGKNSIEPNNENIKEDDILDWEQEPIVDDVLEQYSEFSAGKLVDITHEENSPWDKAKKQTDVQNNRHIVIEKDTMKNYFQSVPLGDDLYELSDETIKQLNDYKKACETGTVQTCTLEELKERYGMAC